MSWQSLVQNDNCVVIMALTTPGFIGGHPSVKLGPGSTTPVGSPAHSGGPAAFS
jgi:hypothetical protein